MTDRWVNIFFFFTLVGFFILFADAEDHARILAGSLFAAALAIIAFILNWLSLNGTISSILLGTIAYGLGGLVGAAVIIAFFISGSVLTKTKLTVNDAGFADKNFRRDGNQVWANGFWFCFWITNWFLTGYHGFMIASVASIAMATADTWATEIGGNRLKAKAWLITTGKSVTPGTDGAVSFSGSIAALLGAFFITLVFALMEFNVPVVVLAIISLSGFLGCFIDSYLGARIQGRVVKWKKKGDSSTLPGASDSSRHGKEKPYIIGNNAVNWIATGITSIISIIAILITDL